MDILDYSQALNNAEWVYWNNNKKLIIKYIKSYVSLYFKDNIESFLNDLSIGDRGFLSSDFINEIRGIINNYKVYNIKQLYDEIMSIYYLKKAD